MKLSDLKPKAVYGSPCNRCGVCCLLEQCAISSMFFGPQKVCPALDFDGPEASCGLFVRPEDFTTESGADWMREFAELSLGIGTSCDAAHSDEDFDAEERLGDSTAMPEDVMLRIKAMIEERVNDRQI